MPWYASVPDSSTPLLCRTHFEKVMHGSTGLWTNGCSERLSDFKIVWLQVERSSSVLIFMMSDASPAKWGNSRIHGRVSDRKKTNGRSDCLHSISRFKIGRTNGWSF